MDKNLSHKTSIPRDYFWVVYWGVCLVFDLWLSDHIHHHPRFDDISPVFWLQMFLAAYFACEKKRQERVCSLRIEASRREWEDRELKGREVL
jgi:hypothetical protein